MLGGAHRTEFTITLINIGLKVEMSQHKSGGQLLEPLKCILFTVGLYVVHYSAQQVIATLKARSTGSVY